MKAEKIKFLVSQLMLSLSTEHLKNLLVSISYMHACMHACSVSLSVQLFASPWTLACQVPTSMGFPRQKYWSGLPFLSPRDFPV